MGTVVCLIRRNNGDIFCLMMIFWFPSVRRVVDTRVR